MNSTNLYGTGGTTRSMEESMTPDVGSEWMWNSDTYLIVDDVPVTVTKVSDGAVWVEVQDDSLLESDARSANKTLSDNGGDIENASECHVFAQYDGQRGEFIPLKRHFIPRGYVDRFAEEFTRR